MQAIQTKFFPCTNYRGARIKAWAEAGSVTIGWDHALNVDENHAKAANALAAKLGWVGTGYGTLVGGCMPTGGYSFVFPARKYKSHDTTALYHNSEMTKVENSEIIGIKFFGDKKDTRQMNITKAQFDAIREILTCEVV